MTAAEQIAVEWRPRPHPLEPAAVVGVGEAARTLGRRALRLDDAALSALTGVAGPRFLLLIGLDLPWVDGAVYLGRDPQAPLLLQPTTLEASAPAALVERLFLSRFSDLAAPLAVLPRSGVVASASAARAVSRAALERWMREAA